MAAAYTTKKLKYLKLKLFFTMFLFGNFPINKRNKPVTYHFWVTGPKQSNRHNAYWRGLFLILLMHKSLRRTLDIKLTA